MHVSGITVPCHTLCHIAIGLPMELRASGVRSQMLYPSDWNGEHDWMEPTQLAGWDQHTSPTVMRQTLSFYYTIYFLGKSTIWDKFFNIMPINNLWANIIGFILLHKIVLFCLRYLDWVITCKFSNKVSVIPFIKSSS